MTERSRRGIGGEPRVGAVRFRRGADRLLHNVICRTLVGCEPSWALALLAALDLSYARRPALFCGLAFRSIDQRRIAATDGAAQPNPGPTSWAWVIADECGVPYFGESGYIGHSTNNVGELMAIAKLLQHMAPTVPLEIRVDSQYAMNVATGKYAAHKNQEVVADIRRMLSGRDVVFTWVAAHQSGGDVLNAHADHAAETAARTRRGRRWGGPVSATASPDEPSPRPRPAHTAKPRGHVQDGCTATTKAGTPCPNVPRRSGLCHLHDPAVQCGALTKAGHPCAVATGGGPCKRHRSQLM